MIEIIGEERTPEHDAATAIAHWFEACWPGVSTSPSEQDAIRLCAGLKLAGYKVSDIDVVLAARFNTPRYVVPKQPFLDPDGKRITGQKVRVRSIVAAIEVKGHDASRLRIEAGSVSVRYLDGWKSATEQNDAQRYALLQYLQDLQAGAPWVYRCVYLTGLPSLPAARGRIQPQAGAIAADADAGALLSAMGSVNGVRKLGGEHAISSGDGALIDRVLAAPVFLPVTPTALDRKRMDRVSSRPVLAREIAGKLSEIAVQLRGHGGAGKTMLLLQSAHEAFSVHGKSCMILTYNHALAADIQRLLALKGIPSGADGAGIDVKTVMAFTFTWLQSLGIAPDVEANGFDAYEDACETALRYLESGAVSNADIGRAKAAHRFMLDPDVILVDEAQDWPLPEARLLAQLHAGKCVVLADGISQLVRGGATDWRDALGGIAPKVIPLEHCLRMKASLAIFANQVAVRAGLPIVLAPSPAAAGGRIIIANTPYSMSHALRKKIVDDALRAGNKPVDLLHCVPAEEVGFSGNQRQSELGITLADQGEMVWDGVDPMARRDYPRSQDMYRIVQYESCRGLEGWVTVLDGLDLFWERKKEEASREIEAIPSDQRPADPGLHARQAAWRWVMIALTRPIDTLVVTLRDENSELGKMFYDIVQSMPDIVESAR